MFKVIGPYKKNVMVFFRLVVLDAFQNSSNICSEFTVLVSLLGIDDNLIT